MATTPPPPTENKGNDSKIMSWFKNLFLDKTHKQYNDIRQLKQASRKKEDDILRASDELTKELTEQNKNLREMNDNS